MGKLYVCGTPIGNLEDVSIRLLKTLRKVDLIACEDTRHTIKLLNRYRIKKRLVSYHKYSQPRQEDFLMAELSDGKAIALVTDAGMPGISDPGSGLIQRAISMGVEMEVVPGPTAIVTALIMSGIDCNGFVFAGFLPRQSGKRQETLNELKQEKRTVVFYEAPHRLLPVLKDIEHIWGDREMAVARELTKIHEEILRGTVSGHLRHFTLNPPRGEICLVVSGYEEPPKTADLDVIKGEVDELIKGGISKKEALRRKAREYGMKRSEIYNYYENCKE